MLYKMVKVCIFNKSNDVSRIDIFETFFECANPKISLTCCTETGTAYQNMFDCERKMAYLTFRLIPYLLRLLGWVELSWNAYSRVYTVDAIPRGDVSEHGVVQLTPVDRTSRRTALPDLLQSVRQRYRLTYSRLQKQSIHIHKISVECAKSTPVDASVNNTNNNGRFFFIYNNALTTYLH